MKYLPPSKHVKGRKSFVSCADPIRAAAPHLTAGRREIRVSSRIAFSVQPATACRVSGRCKSNIHVLTTEIDARCHGVLCFGCSESRSTFSHTRFCKSRDIQSRSSTARRMINCISLIAFHRVASGSSFCSCPDAPFLYSNENRRNGRPSMLLKHI